MEKVGISGTIKLFGTPAEETLVGKVYMARDGVFTGVDTMMAWHPGKENAVISGSMAMNSIIYEFYGKSAHAAVAPFDARSSLDAVEVMNYAANHLREHLLREAMLQYVIPHGGIFPNVVPPYDRSWYFIRAHNRRILKPLVDLLARCAEGAAHATETEVKITTITGTYEMLYVEAAARVMHANLEAIQPPRLTPEEKAFPKNKFGYSDPDESVSGPIVEVGPWSNELGNVSWLVPFAFVMTSCRAPRNTGAPRLRHRAVPDGPGRKGDALRGQGPLRHGIGLLDEAGASRERSGGMEGKDKRIRLRPHRTARAEAAENFRGGFDPLTPRVLKDRRAVTGKNRLRRLFQRPIRPRRRFGGLPRPGLLQSRR